MGEKRIGTKKDRYKEERDRENGIGSKREGERDRKKEQWSSRNRKIIIGRSGS